MRRVRSYIDKNPPGIATLVYSVNPLEIDNGVFNRVEEYPTNQFLAPVYSFSSGKVIVNFNRKFYNPSVSLMPKSVFIPSANQRAYFDYRLTSSQILEISLLFNDNTLVDLQTINYIQFSYSVTSYSVPH